MKVEVLEVERKEGYILRKELATDSDGRRTLRTLGYNIYGHLIGSELLTKDLVENWGVYPEMINLNDAMCTIGFNVNEQRWYGWSYRGICGFGIGDMLFEASKGTEETPILKHGDKRIENLDEAKAAAINFARYIAV